MADVEVAARPPAKRGRPVDPGKRAAIIDAAGCAFITDGFAGATMDQIAALAGVSKLTLYRHFGSKEELFGAALKTKCDELMDPETLDQARALPLRDGLVNVARAFLNLIIAPECIAIHRVLCVEAERNPGLAKLFFQNAILYTKAKVIAFLTHYVDRGELRIADIEMAAWDLLSLVKTRPHMSVLLGIQQVAPADIDRHVAHCVDLVLVAWRAA